MANGLERKGSEFQAALPDEGSIAEAIQAAAPGAKVVAALQHVPAKALGDLDRELESDVLVVGDDDDARATVLELVGADPGPARLRRRLAPQRPRDRSIRGAAAHDQPPPPR